MVLPSFVERACANEDLIVYDDGRQSRSFSFVGTFVDVLLRAVSVPAAWDLTDRALNIGAVAATGILDLARLVIRRAESTSSIVHLPYDAVFPNCRDLAARIPDTTRLTSLIGPTEWPSIEQIVASVLDGMRR